MDLEWSAMDRLGVLLVGCVMIPLAHGGDDLKIESRWGTPWDRGSHVTYVKGEFLRGEDCWGADGACAHPTEIYLSRCGEWSVLKLKGTFYDVTDTASDDSGPSTSPTTAQQIRPRSDGVVRVVRESGDTGERKLMFGYTARHIITTEKFDLSRSTCSVRSMHTFDGWYIDPPYSNKCSIEQDEVFDRFFPELVGCSDKVVVERKGPARGFELTETETWMENGRPMSSGSEVTAISHEDLDPSLFAKPADVRPFSEIHNRRKRVVQSDSQPASKP